MAQGKGLQSGEMCGRLCRQHAIVAATAIAGALFFGSAYAGTECYLYDELGRLKSAVHADGKLVAYDLDAAGNRENLNTTTLAAAA